MPKIPDQLSYDCRDFLRSCFKYDLKERSSVMDLMKHSFVNFLPPSHSAGTNTSMSGGITRRRQQDSVKDSFTDLRLINKDVPNPKNLGKKNKLGKEEIFSIQESGMEDSDLKVTSSKKKKKIRPKIKVKRNRLIANDSKVSVHHVESSFDAKDLRAYSSNVNPKIVKKFSYFP